jgi:methylglyoxal synthase
MNIAIISHDNIKHQMLSFTNNNKDFFINEKIKIFATKNTGSILINSGFSNIQLLKSGPLGGDAQIASMIVDGKIDSVFFFIDPLHAHVHDVDIYMLLRICNVYNVPLATNLASASLIIDSLVIKYSLNLLTETIK